LYLIQRKSITIVDFQLITGFHAPDRTDGYSGLFRQIDLVQSEQCSGSLKLPSCVSCQYEQDNPNINKKKALTDWLK
jgi:hypothetical protein